LAGDVTEICARPSGLDFRFVSPRAATGAAILLMHHPKRNRDAPGTPSTAEIEGDNVYCLRL
jgi:hypothetical protein